jgi:hypothetical protein
MLRIKGFRARENLKRSTLVSFGEPRYILTLKASNRSVSEAAESSCLNIEIPLFYGLSTYSVKKETILIQTEVITHASLLCIWEIPDTTVWAKLQHQNKSKEGATVRWKGLVRLRRCRLLVMVKRLLNSFLNISVPSAFGHRLGILFSSSSFLVYSFSGRLFSSTAPLYTHEQLGFYSNVSQTRTSIETYVCCWFGIYSTSFGIFYFFFRLLPLNSLRSTHPNDDEFAFDWR